MHKLLKTAFTLIELLVVIAIIGILSGLIIVGLSGMTQKATIAKAQVFSNSLRNALMMNLVSEWKFDEGTGTTTADSWKGGNSGTLGGTTTPAWKTNYNCVDGSCLQFNGNGIISVTDSDSLNIINAITIGGWINITTRDRYNYIISKGYLYSTAHGLRITSYPTTNKFVFSLGNGAAFTEIYSNDVYSANSWYYVVGTWDGNNLKMYVNGILQNQTSTLASPLQFETNKTVYLGLSLIGLIDEVRLYDSVVPTSQITEQYYAGLNKLLASRGITQEEYQGRIGELAITQP